MAISKSQIIENAQRYTASSNFGAAIAEWEKLLSEPPQAQDGNIYNTIADLYLRKNDKENAVNTCIKAASVYKETGFELKGVALLKKIFKIDPDRIDIHEKLADINVERGLTGSAVSGYQQTVKLYIQRGSFTAAIGVYKKLARFYPEDPEIPLAIARLHQKMEQNREAILAYEQAEAIYESKKMMTEARQIVEEIVKLNPSYIKHLAKRESSVAELDAIVSPKDAALPAASIQKEMWPNPLETSGFGPEDSFLSLNLDTEQEKGSAPSALHPSPAHQPWAFDPAKGISSSTTVPPFFPKEPPSVLQPPSPIENIEGVPLHNTHLSTGSFLKLSEEVSPKEPAPHNISHGEPNMLPQQMDAPTRSPRPNETPDVSEVIFRAHLAEVDVYLRYGLYQNAIEKLLMAKELAPMREEPYLRLRELYLKEGHNEKAANEVLTLMRLYEQQGKLDKRDALLSEMRTVDPYEQKTAQWGGGPAPYAAPPLAPPARERSALPSYREGAFQALPKTSPLRSFMPENSPSFQEARVSPVRGADSRGEDGYVDLGSAMVEEFGEITQTPLIPPVAEKGSEKSLYEDKRRQYIETCYHMGIAHKEMGNYEKAVRELEQALAGSTGKQFREVLLLLAVCYAESGYVAQAIEVLQGGGEDPRCDTDSRPFVQYELASYFEQLGDKERSFTLYKEIYRAHPHFKDVSGKVKEIPYHRRADTGQRHPEAMPDQEDSAAFTRSRGVESLKDKRRISYV